MLGIVIIILFWREARKNKDRVFRLMWLAIVLSFAFYLPVVIWSRSIPSIGVLMIPKTIAYVWMVVMGMNLLKAGMRFEKEKRKGAIWSKCPFSLLIISISPYTSDMSCQSHDLVRITIFIIIPYIDNGCFSIFRNDISGSIDN